MPVRQEGGPRARGTYLVLGVLEVEHNAAVFALVAVVGDVEQVEHLLLNVESHLPDFALCHHEVVTVAGSTRDTKPCEPSTCTWFSNRRPSP